MSLTQRYALAQAALKAGASADTMAAIADLAPIYSPETAHAVDRLERAEALGRIRTAYMVELPKAVRS